MPILTLDELVTAVRAEIGDSTNMAMGVDALPGIRQMLKRIQETYYEDFDWPHLKIFREEEIYAGQNIYTFNSDVDSRRIFGAWAKNNDSWIPLEFGITPEHYNSSNPENGDSDTLPLRWDYAEENQFEIWPVPNEDTRIRFRVMKQLAPLAAGSNKCELDSNLLILTAAAELLARAKSEDAQLKLSIATSHYNRLKGRYFKSRMFVNGKSDWDTSGRSGRSRIIIGSTGKTATSSPIDTEGGDIIVTEG
jgi:hypothetical protein